MRNAQAQRPASQELGVRTTPIDRHFRHNYAGFVPTPARGETDPRAPSAPAPLLTAASVVVVEAVLLLGLGVLELASMDERRLIMGLTTAAFFVGAACGLLACAWRRWR